MERKALIFFLLVGCSTVPERSVPKKIVGGVKYAYVGQWGAGPKFVVYANGDISKEFYDSMEQFKNPRTHALPKAIWKENLGRLDE